MAPPMQNNKMNDCEIPSETENRFSCIEWNYMFIIGICTLYVYLLHKSGNKSKMVNDE